MKVNELRKIIADIDGDYDIEIFVGHAKYELDSVGIARYGEAVSLHSEIPESIPSEP